MATQPIHSSQVHTANLAGRKPAIQSQPLRALQVAKAGDADSVDITGKVKFAGNKQESKNTEESSWLGSIANTGKKTAAAVALGTTCFIASNLFTIPAGIIMMCTGVGIVPGLATILLGPIVAGALGAYAGSRC